MPLRNLYRFCSYINNEIGLWLGFVVVVVGGFIELYLVLVRRGLLEAPGALSTIAREWALVPETGAENEGNLKRKATQRRATALGTALPTPP